MMKKILFVSLLLVVLPVYASHIVGGEFELVHISGYTYRLNLIYYFDEKDGDQGNKTQDAIIHVKIFRSIDGAIMDFVDLPFVSQSPVNYTQPACSNSKVITSRQYYSTIITLAPEKYNSPDGYYVVWERCCRNYSIRNIISENTNGAQNAPDAAGQTFYLKFPPVIKDGVQFIDSSPRLFPPLSDYGCPGRPYFANFAGTDDDGDSLVYALVTPFDTQAHNSYPFIGPAPYPDVRWANNYSLSNIMRGSPDLNISIDGLLRVTPLDTGIYVFAVKVEEYRDKVKIGETRRDFQFYVTDGCEPDQPPQISGKKLTDAAFSYSHNMFVSFPSTVSDGNRCIEVQVSDPDSTDPLHDNFENVSIRVVPLNFRNKDISGTLPPTTTAALINGSTATFRICFPACPYINAPMQIGIVAFDDACSLPLSDTLKVIITIDPPPNKNAYFLPLKTVSAQLNEGEQGSWPFAAKDDDGDNMIISLTTDGFVLKDAGMTFKILNQQAGSATGVLDWDAFCKNYEFTKKSDFTVKVLVNDIDKCNTTHFDTAIYHLKVLLPQINPKLRIYNEATAKDVTSSLVSMNLGHIGLNVVGTDTDATTADILNLSLLSVEGSGPTEGYTFNNATGLHEVESKFLWDFDCTSFKDTTYSNDYTLKFSVTNNHCKTPKADTAVVKLNISDIKSTDEHFLPANVITTYPDHCNDFFAIEGFESEPNCNGQVRQVPSVPADNCANRFEHVRIYDRWGKQVFESADRKFRWYAATETAGVYYYVIEFTHGQYKSPITVIH